nr:variable surface lipoprotein [Mycoplasmopsis bovis]
MKKSKFLLLGSVASLASIPFVAAKCGETKEEKKPRSGQTRSKIHQLTQDQGTTTNKTRYTN